MFKNFRTALIQLNESLYSLHPNLFVVGKLPDMILWQMGVNDGLQEWATYNPPGPTKPSVVSTSSVRLFIININSLALQIQNFLQLNIVLSTKGIVTWEIYLHDPKHLTLNIVKLYGKDKIKPEPGRSTTYETEPTEVYHINKENDPCIPEKENVENMWDCITDHIYQDMNCSLPWSYKKTAPLCSSPGEYDTYHTRTTTALNFDTGDIEKAIHCIPACKRIEYSTKLERVLKEEHRITDDKLEIQIYFNRDKFPVKEQYYIYDGANFIADFGGYLGLLLGYSLLAFYDTLVELIKTIYEKCNKRRQRKDKLKNYNNA